MIDLPDTGQIRWRWCTFLSKPIPRGLHDPAIEFSHDHPRRFPHPYPIQSDRNPTGRIPFSQLIRRLSCGAPRPVLQWSFSAWPPRLGANSRRQPTAAGQMIDRLGQPGDPDHRQIVERGRLGGAGGGQQIQALFLIMEKLQ